MKTTLLSISFIAFVLLFSFSKPKKPITDLEGMKKALKLGYSYIPSGKTLVDGDTVSCQGFFMMKEEVSNFSYLEYVSDLKKNNRPEEYLQALPDTLKWHNPGNFHLEKYINYYFRHPAYRNYPVVNVSKQQAQKYCEWLTQVWRKNTGNQFIVFRLPTRAEFLRAANGSKMDRPYAWNSPYLRRNDGKFQCNFMTIGAGAISRDSTGKLVVKNFPMDYLAQGAEYADLTAPVRSFWPNEYDLYNLNGNVSEMVAETNIAVGGDWNSPGYDIRNQSTKKFTEATPTVGFRPVMTFVELKMDNGTIEK
ncbi:SUMF1/EgtB/PvdO family nonheme iron enzyme [Fluviicola sp.]|uniref:formylglycine-generating enzyme family protein n=1 Tax=Fluviicola sp. TaxID=1917219 RepID=UPI0031D133C7